MADQETKFYWLKLKRDFFKRHDIRIIEEMPNGKDYILFYLKLLLESVDHEGNLRFSDSIPYNEQMLSVVTNTNIDTVRSAMKIFVELKMMDILDDQTIYMTEINKLIGCETKWAEKKRLYREKRDNVLSLSARCPQDVRQEIDIEKEIELDKVSKQVSKERKNINNNLTSAHTCESYDEVFDNFSVDGEYRNAVINFIRHLKVNFGLVMLNERLEKLIIRLDMFYRNDNDKVLAINDAIAKGYKRLDCEG